MEWILSQLTGIIAIIAGAIAYFSMDRKLKKQQLLLNENALQRQKAERLDLKSAKIEATGRGENGVAYFFVKNVGKATARNVRFSLAPDLALELNPFPLKIMSPTDSVRVGVNLSLNDPISTLGTFTWEDELGEHSSIHVLSFT